MATQRICTWRFKKAGIGIVGDNMDMTNTCSCSDHDNLHNTSTPVYDSNDHAFIRAHKTNSCVYVPAPHEGDPDLYVMPKCGGGMGGSTQPE